MTLHHPCAGQDVPISVCDKMVPPKQLNTVKLLVLKCSRGYVTLVLDRMYQLLCATKWYLRNS
jgi:hypothetical protein